jgi:hypothetical protein
MGRPVGERPTESAHSKTHRADGGSHDHGMREQLARADAAAGRAAANERASSRVALVAGRGSDRCSVRRRCADFADGDAESRPKPQPRCEGNPNAAPGVELEFKSVPLLAGADCARHCKVYGQTEPATNLPKPKADPRNAESCKEALGQTNGDRDSDFPSTLGEAIRFGEADNQLGGS